MRIYLELKIKSVLMVGYILALVLQGSGTIINFTGDLIDGAISMLETLMNTF